MFEFNFVQSMDDYSLFIRNKDSTFVVLLVYVDDIVLTGNYKIKISIVKDFLKSKYLIKDLGKLNCFFVIEVLNRENGIYLSQRKYCLELLHDFVLLGCKPVKTPLDMNTAISDIGIEDKDDILSNITEYLKLIGN